MNQYFKTQCIFLLFLITLLIGISIVNHILQKVSLFEKKEQKILTLEVHNQRIEKVPDEHPIRILVPRLSIDTKIVEAPVVDGSWTVSDTSANHGIGSAYPGQKGNMVIFAHAMPRLFQPLQNISIGDEIDIFTKEKWYIYKVVDVINVTPDQTTAVSQSKDERITLFTCSGSSDEKRLIIIGKPLYEVAIGKFVKFTSFPS